MYRVSTVLLSALLLTACSGMVFAAPLPTATLTATPPLPTATPSATPTFTLTPTFTVTLTPVPTWVSQGPDHIHVPILLYHHVAVSPVNSRYYVRPDRFEDQLKLLHNWEYSPITTSRLVETITRGSLLPPRPILITFDDGNEDNYTTAFPIMQKYGFTGVLYIVADYVDTPGYMTAAQIKEMAAAGWEVGSHSLTHRDLTQNPDAQRGEIVESRKKLEAMLGVPILTFAYPFGRLDNSAADYAHFAGYIAAMDATGFTADQGMGNLFALQRCEIKGSDNAKSITRFLPWLGDPIFLPTPTATATRIPSRTPIPTWTWNP